MFDKFVELVEQIYGKKRPIPLHEPVFNGNEKKYLLDTIDSTFVSSIGDYVNKFESEIARFTGMKHAVSTVNGTAALHIALKLAGVENDQEVVTQSLTFVATCNAIRYCNSEPVFVDVDPETLSLSPESMKEFLAENCEIRDDGFCWNRKSNRIIRACLPMHTFGFPARLDEINTICEKYNIVLVEDAAEALGSFYKDNHAGKTASIAILSFNGNKIITSGGGGMILTDNDNHAASARHLTTTARQKTTFMFMHDQVGYNYRLPNINAALGLAQVELLPEFIRRKRELATCYQKWGDENGMQFVLEPKDSSANYWLNTIVAEDREQRDKLLEHCNVNGILVRPVWTPMHKLPMYEHCKSSTLKITEWLSERLVNVPSSVPQF